MTEAVKKKIGRVKEGVYITVIGAFILTVLYSGKDILMVGIRQPDINIQLNKHINEVDSMRRYTNENTQKRIDDVKVDIKEDLTEIKTELRDIKRCIYYGRNNNDLTIK